MNREPYIRKVNYYETDQMAVVHHSNYIRYFEEARVDYLRRNGLDFAEAEQNYGIMFPVMDVSCKYVKSAKFNDELHIFVKLERFTGVKFFLSYCVCFPDGSICAEGATTLGIIDRNYMPVNLRRHYPDLYAKFVSLAEDHHS